MQADGIGQIYPIIDEVACVECGRCQSVCPILNPVIKRNPQKAFAAWSANGRERATSASGGIAVEVYKEALAEDYKAAGAKMNEDFTVTFSLTDKEEDLEGFKNSKYVFSDMYSLFPQLKELLKGGGKAVVIGLPCQIAAVRKVFNDHHNLLLMDLVCHGSTPYTYLRQHISSLEKKCKSVAKRMSFRDPCAYTYTFTFALYNADNHRFYAKRTKHGDSYQYGFHRWVSYRENCYHCKFACPQRVGDVTLCDYTGLGKFTPCLYSYHNVSCILMNTDKGTAFIRKLIDKKRIIAEERPLQEPILGNAQLQRPTPKTQDRYKFEKRIHQTGGDFELAIAPLVREWMWKECIRPMTAVLKNFVKNMLQILGLK